MWSRGQICERIGQFGAVDVNPIAIVNPHMIGGKRQGIVVQRGIPGKCYLPNTFNDLKILRGVGSDDCFSEGGDDGDVITGHDKTCYR